ncbi:hypothetical protein SEA_MORGANA_155 [Gordonia phage Morgana]|uniref:Head-to-tail stopper n=1 Tax=Gordonia phage Morgana TaxID=3137292 RepID=A0AAX4RBP7_9CAUD
MSNDRILYRNGDHVRTGIELDPSGSGHVPTGWKRVGDLSGLQAAVDIHVTEVKGVITTSDGRAREFRIGTDGVWQQWGGERADHGNTVDAIDAMTAALIEDGHLASE